MNRQPPGSVPSAHRSALDRDTPTDHPRCTGETPHLLSLSAAGQPAPDDAAGVKDLPTAPPPASARPLTPRRHPMLPTNSQRRREKQRGSSAPALTRPHSFSPDAPSN